MMREQSGRLAHPFRATWFRADLSAKPIHPVPKGRELQPTSLAELTLRKPAPLEFPDDSRPMLPTTPNVTLLLAHAPSIAAANRHGETSPAERLRIARNL
jgi:hypothetical protein